MNPFLLRTVVYPAYRVVKRDQVRSYIREFDRTQWLSRPEILEYQWTKLLQLLRHAYQTVPYYRERFDYAGLTPEKVESPEDFRRLPVLTKDVIRTRLSDLTISTSSKEQLHRDGTGGSTGERVWFYLDDRAKQARQSMVLRGNSWAGAKLGDRQATLWGASFDLTSHQQLMGRLKSSLLNTMFLSSYNLSQERLRDYVEALGRFQPKLLTSYPGPLMAFADFLIAHPEHSVRPGAIIASGEALFDHNREVIEKVFGCPVFNRYGSREFGAIAHECDAHSGLHINADRLFVEYLKEEGTPAATGEPGEMVITDLDNYGMPFIRYRIDDIAVPSDLICPCGRGLPLIERIEGRVFDTIVTPSGAKFPGTFWTLLSRAVPGILKFQIVQREPSSVLFKIIPGEGFERESLKKLDGIIAEHTQGELQANFEIVDSIPLTESGKHRFIISEMAGPGTHGSL
ncbi:MAG: phenylacetate--CoA ligase family protein [Armatimonadetes bacterium]|nr:phenylacetate--CoA ligase family protein [Armatimonadota bacterium]